MKKTQIALGFALGAAVTSALFLGVGTGGSASASGSQAAPPVRETLAKTNPPVANGYSLYLLRTTALPGTLLAKHLHPGFQDVYVLQGTTTYTVYKGVARVYRGPADETSKPTQVITAGHTGTLRPGDWLVETPTLVHSALVTSKGPLVVLQSGLLKTGEPLAVPVS